MEQPNDSCADGAASGSTGNGAAVKFRSKWPWLTLAIGERFVMEGVRDTTARGAASAASKRLGRRFVTTKERGGVWITRTE